MPNSEVAFPLWSTVFGFVIGAVVGSFLNMVIWRLPRRISFVNPSKSFCPKCDHPLEAIDLVPLLSWASTGGKCRYCKAPVAPRYFIVEVVTAVLFSALWYRFLVAGYQPLETVFYMLETAGLIAVIFIDWEMLIIPDELNAYLLIVAVLYRAFDRTLLQGLEGGLMGWGLLWGITFLGRVAFKKDAMGHGDIKMMRGVGFLLGMLLVTASLGMAVILGLVVGLTLIGYSSLRRKKDAAAADEEEPYDEKPESLSSLIFCGAWYLLCLDVLVLPFPKLSERVEALVWKLDGRPAEELAAHRASEHGLEEDNWKPSITTIPFGPYLAAGALLCMLFAGPITTSILGWWDSSTGRSADRASSLFPRERFATETASHSYRLAKTADRVEPTCFLSKQVGIGAFGAEYRL